MKTTLKSTAVRLTSGLLAGMMFGSMIVTGATTAFAAEPPTPNNKFEQMLAETHMPASSADVDDSTPSGAMLKALLEQMENSGDLGVGQNPATLPDWGQGKEGDDWYIDELKDMMPVSMEIQVADASISPETIEAMGLPLDGNGDGVLDTVYESNFAQDLAKEGLKGLVHGSPTGVINWGIDKLFSLAFGEKPSEVQELAGQMQKGFKEINAKLDAIKAQLDQVMEALKKVMKEQELKNYRDDIANASNVRAQLDTQMAVTRLNLESAGKAPEKRQAMLDKFNGATINGTSPYLATAALGDTLSRTMNCSQMDMFHINNVFTLNTHFPWKHQQVMMNANFDNYYLYTYMEMLVYCKLSLLWQIEKNKNNETERTNYISIYKVLITGDSTRNLVSNAAKVEAAYNGAPKIRDTAIEDFRDGNTVKHVVRITNGKPYFNDTNIYRALLDFKKPYNLLWYTLNNSLYKTLKADSYLGLAASGDWKYFKTKCGADYLSKMRSMGGIDIPTNTNVDFAVRDSVNVTSRALNTYYLNTALYNLQNERLNGQASTLFTYSGVLSFDDFHVSMEPRPVLLIYSDECSTGETNTSVEGQVVSVNEQGFTFAPDQTDDVLPGLDLNEENHVTLSYSENLAIIAPEGEDARLVPGDKVLVNYRTEEEINENGEANLQLFLDEVKVLARGHEMMEGTLTSLPNESQVFALTDAEGLVHEYTLVTGATVEGELHEGCQLNVTYATGQNPMPGEAPAAIKVICTETPAPAPQTDSGNVDAYAGNALMLDNGNGYLLDGETAVEGTLEAGCHVELTYIQTATGLKVLSIHCNAMPGPLPVPTPEPPVPTPEPLAFN